MMYSCLRPFVLPLAFIGLASSLVSSAYSQEKPSILIQGEDLLKDIQSFDIIDIRDPKAYSEGHIDFSVLVNLSAWKDGTKESLKNDDFWNTQIGGLGIDGSRPIVVYGTPLTDVARTWWLLKYLGCKDVRILDGGLPGFVAAGGTPGTLLAKRKGLTFKPNYQKDRLIEADELLKLGVQDKKCQIVDNRTEAEYTGADVKGARGGHIPNATHSDWQSYVGKDGKFLPKSELEAIVSKAGIDLNNPLVTHCQSGGRSSVGAFVLELLSGKPVRNYYRSWGEWSSRDDLPVISK